MPDDAKPARTERGGMPLDRDLPHLLGRATSRMPTYTRNGADTHTPPIANPPQRNAAGGLPVDKVLNHAPPSGGLRRDRG